MKNNHDLINHLESLEKDVSPKLKRKFNKVINRLVKIIGNAPSISMPLSVSINTGGEELWLEWKNGYVFVNVISGGAEIKCKISSGGELSYFAPSFVSVSDEILLAGMLGMKGKYVKKLN